MNANLVLIWGGKYQAISVSWKKKPESSILDSVCSPLLHMLIFWILSNCTTAVNHGKPHHYPYLDNPDKCWKHTSLPIYNFLWLLYLNNLCFREEPKKIFWAQWRHGQKLKSQSNLFFDFESSLKIVFFYLKEGALWSRSAANQMHFSFSSTRAYNPDRSSSEFSRWVSRCYEQIMFRWGSDEAIFEISDFLLANWFVEFWNF